MKTVHDTARRADRKGYDLFLFLSILCTLQTFVHLASTEWIVNSVYSLALGEREWKYVAGVIIIFGALEGIFMLLGLVKDRVELGFLYSLNYSIRNTLNCKLADVKMEYFETHQSMVRIHDVKSRMQEVFPKYVRSIVTYITAVPLLLIYSVYPLPVALLERVLPKLGKIPEQPVRPVFLMGNLIPAETEIVLLFLVIFLHRVPV